MENEKLIESLWTLFSQQKWSEAKSLFHEEFIAEWPQSRERFIGADNFVNMNSAYPGNHTIELLRIISTDSKVVSAVYVHADTGQKAFASSFFDIKDNKIWKLTEFWSDTYDSPEWRKDFVVRY